jgi:hypothetical protein
MDLAMQLNNILASPAFSGWTQGEPLKIDNFLYTAEGKPRVSIFSIAHLSDEERMFFVSMLLGRFIAWMRRQEGSSGLRCLLYMDEIFGYFPPNGNPPSKKPMLLLLKQARAYGIGVVLSTQNPVDLDYKGLSNIGTWFVGRLQTRQDQDRVMAGIAGSSDAFSEKEIRAMLSDMRGRTFLMYSTRYDEPVLFETRWAMSYLRGPVSLAELGRLLPDTPGTAAADTEQERQAPSVDGREYSPVPPMVGAGITQCFLPSQLPVEELRFRPWLVGTATVRFFKQSRGIDETRDVTLRLPAGDGDAMDWQEAESFVFEEESCMDTPPDRSLFAPLSPVFAGLKNTRSLEKQFDDYLYHSMELPLFTAPSLKLVGRPGASEAEFRKRLADVLRSKKEAEADKIKDRYAKKQEQLQARLEKAYAKIDKEKGDVTAKGLDTVLSIGGAVLGALFGRKTLSVTNANRTMRSIRGAGRVLKEKGDVQRAEQAAALLEQDVEDLALELREKLAALAERYDPAAVKLETLRITPRHSDIYNLKLCLTWEPVLDIPTDGEPS